MREDTKDPDLKKQSKLLWVPLWALCLVGGATLFYFVGREVGRQNSFEQVWDGASGNHQLALEGLLQGGVIESNRAALPLIQTEQAFIDEVGKDTPDGAVALSRLAGFHALQGDFKASQDAYEELLVILKKRLGTDHPDVKVVEENIRILKRLSAGQAPGIQTTETNPPPMAQGSTGAPTKP